MKVTELHELDAWIAEHVMGWKRMTNAEAMGIENLESFTKPELEHIKKLSDQWYNSANKHIADVVGECDCGQHNTSWNPTTNPAAAFEVFKKCHDKCGFVETGRVKVAPYNYCVCAKYLPEANFAFEATTLELAICLFAKKLFTKL